jgi:hypothetical protein
MKCKKCNAIMDNAKCNHQIDQIIQIIHIRCNKCKKGKLFVNLKLNNVKRCPLGPFGMGPIGMIFAVILKTCICQYNRIKIGSHI